MAEAVTEALGRLAALLEEETVAIYRRRDQVNTVLNDALRAIQHLLKNDDLQSGGNEGFKNDLRRVAYDIEDVIDTFLAEIDSYYHRKDFKGCAKRCLHKPREMLNRRKRRYWMENIRERIGAVILWKGVGDIRRIDEGAGPETLKLLERRRLEACKEDEPKNVVGLEMEINELVTLLAEEGEPRRCVISVVGQAGLGKTVLARQVYNRAKSCFFVSAWIHVSKQPKKNEVLRELCKAVSPSSSRHEITGMGEGEMQEILQKQLEQKKYLVVLDDVWTGEAWDALKVVLPDGSMGSRVLITTRNASVAKHADPLTSPHRPPLLNLEDSCKLFYRNAFPTSPDSCPHELASLATQIVGRCGGLPLALAAFGEILSSKREQTPQAWERFVEGLDWHLSKGDGKIISCILALSFDDLPDALKPCLLYCSAFPRDSEIGVERLLRLWIAEGFVEKQDKMRLEAVALDWLHELVDRSLVQPCKWKPLGQIKSCRIHGVLRATLVATAKEQNFFQIHSAGSFHERLEGRRLAIHHHLEPKTCLSLPLARAFISFTESGPPHNFKLLKVLDLEGARSFKTLPEEIGDLVLLRYLGLRHTSIEKLSRSTKKLYNLQTLDLRTSATVRLSKSRLYSKNLKAKHIKMMTNLRHLYFGNRHGDNLNAMEVPDDFGVNGAFKELQTLSYVKAGGWVENGLPNMTSLRKLGMQSIEAYPSALEAIAKLSNLQSLYLHGRLENLTTDEFKNLTKLTLDSSGLRENPFSGLRTLQSLRSLRLINNAYVGNAMSCSDGFPSLEVLNLGNLEHLKDVEVGSEAFPRLRYMTIASCENLDKIPQGLENVSSLKELKLINMPARLVEKVDREVGVDWHRIKHSGSIIIQRN